MARFGVLLAAILLAASPGSASRWDQEGGDSARSGVVDLPAGDLDVVASFDLADSQQVLSDGMGAYVATPHGLIGLRLTVVEQTSSDIPVTNTDRPFSGCEFLRLDMATLQIEVLGGGFACPSGAHLTAYDAVADELLVAVDGLPGEELLQAFRAGDGSKSWGYAPPLLPASAPPNPGTNQADFIMVGAWDSVSRILYAGFGEQSSGENLIVALQVDGRRELWKRSITAADLRGGPAEATPVKDLLGQTAGAGRFAPAWITLTTTGLVVTGSVSGEVGGWTSGMVFLDLDGNVRGRLVAGESAAQEMAREGGIPGTVQHATNPAAAFRNLAAFRYANQILMVDPLTGVVVNMDNLPMYPGTSRQAPPAWGRDHLLFPSTRSAVIYSSNGGERLAEWISPSTGTVAGIVLEDGGSAYALVSKNTAEGLQAIVHRFDPATGMNQQDLRIVGSLQAPTSSFQAWRDQQLVQMPDASGLFMWSESGVAAVLRVRVAAERPALEVDDPYAAIGSAIHPLVSWPAGGGLESVSIAWGDGVTEELAPGDQPSRVYPLRGDYTIRVTGNYQDGTTATGSLVVHPGMPRPAELNFLQTAFAPENQNLTFGVLGLVLTLLGGLIAVLARQRRKSQIADGLIVLDSIKDQGRKDPVGAIGRLAPFRADLRRRLAAGRLDDSQYSALELDVRELLQLLRQRLLAGIGSSLSAAFLDALDVALQDGRLEPAERKALATGLAHERGLPRTDRQRLAGLIASLPG